MCFVCQKVVTLHPQVRKVAQLVAHYVRDVGVGRSNRLFPTMQGSFLGRMAGERAFCFVTW